MIYTNLTDYQNNTAIITEDGEQISYGKLDHCCHNLVKEVNGRCLVFNLCSNELGSLVGYVGFLKNNIVPLMLPSSLDDEMLANFIDVYKPDYIHLPDCMAQKFSGYQKVYSDIGYTLLKTPFYHEFELNDELALLLTTSGSTGSPKLVRQSYKNLKANTESIVEYLGLNETERPITTLPMNYTYGLSIINSHLWVGASVILTEKTLVQKEFWQQFKSHKATSFGGVPYSYEMLHRMHFFRMDLPSLKTMTQAGGKLSPELHQKFAKFTKDTHRKFIVMYGQTEATARMSYLPHGNSLDKYGSMGIAIPGGRFSLIDVNGNLITEPEVVGELVYEGHNVTLGYAECAEDLKKSDERFGRLVTGDMAKFDADGFYYIVGRKKRFLKIFGNRVNLDETEGLIKANFPDLECACAGVDDLMRIYITDLTQTERILAFITQKTTLNKQAFKVDCIAKIPKNESGKTLYRELELGSV